jgi:hypothetical protein
MTIITKASAKLYFVTGAFPTQNNFADTIDSYLGLNEGNQTIGGPVTFSANVAFADTISVSAKLTGASASFSGKVSADGGLNTTVVSAASLNITGDILAANGRATVSAATIGNTVSAATLFASTITVSGASITGVKGTTSVLASVSGAVTSGHIATWDTGGNLQDGGTAPVGITSFATNSPSSGTTDSISSIPSTAKRIIVNFIGLAIGTAQSVTMQVGPVGGVVATGYKGSHVLFTGATPTQSTDSTNISIITTNGGSQGPNGSIIFELVGTNSYAFHGIITQGTGATPVSQIISGSITLTGALSVITLTAGTAFSAGSWNVSYE